MITTLVPTAEGTDTAWTLGAGASKTAAVTPPDDDATSYIHSNSANARNGFVMSNLPGPAKDVTTHAVVHRIQEANGTDTVQAYIRKSGGTYHDATARGAGPVWTTYTETDVVSCTVAEVNAAELGMLRNPGNNVFPRCTTLKWDVTHTVFAGGFVLLMLEWLGPLVAVGLHEMPSVARGLYRESGRRHRLLPEELVTAWRELREGRYAKHFVLSPA